MKQTTLVALTLTSVLALVGGCANQDTAGIGSIGDGSDSDTGISSGSAVSSAASAGANSKLEAQLADRDAEIARLRGEIDNGASSSSTSGGMGGSGDLFPPNAKPGHCYARVLIPAEFETTTDSVLKQEAGFRYEVVPAVLESVTDQVVVKEASTKLEVIPATYKSVTEQVLVKPASTKLVQVPADYETVTETILDKPAHTVWKRGSGAVDGALKTAVDQSTGEVVCLVEVPATYKTVKKSVLKSPATTQEVEIPAEYRTVSRKVVDTPATTRTIEIPAVYKTVKKQKLVTPASKTKIDIPAEYETVTKKKKISEEKLEWREVLCDVNMTDTVVRSIQSKLDSSGYINGGIDGVLGPNTLSAVNRFAKKNGLPVGKNYIALETAKSLGVDL